jgi:hypothetical protein
VPLGRRAPHGANVSQLGNAPPGGRRGPSANGPTRKLRRQEIADDRRDERSAHRLKCPLARRYHHLIKTFWGWGDQQLPDGTLFWTEPSRHTYVTTPGSALLFPALCAPTGELAPPNPTSAGAPCADRTAMMPNANAPPPPASPPNTNKTGKDGAKNCESSLTMSRRPSRNAAAAQPNPERITALQSAAAWRSFAAFW